MGRSKQTLSPASAKVMSPKPVLKRPMPSGTDSEEDENDQSIAAVMANGFPKTKKGKFTIPEMENLGSSDDETDQESGSESGDDESEDNINVDEEDGSDTDDEDDDGDEEDEDDEEDDSNEEETESKALLNALLPMKPHSTDEVDQTTKKQKLSSAKPINSNNAEVAELSAGTECLLIPAPPLNLKSVKRKLSEMGHSVSNVKHLSVPFALVTVPTLADAKKLLLSDQPISVDNTDLKFIHLQGSVDALVNTKRGDVTTSLLVGSIPKTVTVEMLKSKLPRGCECTSIRLLQKGPRNVRFNGAFINFEVVEDARTAFEALSNVYFDNQRLYVSYTKPWPSVSGLRGTTKSLEVSQLPPGITESQLKSIFKTAIVFKTLSRKNETSCRLDFPNRAAAEKAYDDYTKNSAGESKLQLHFVPYHAQNDPRLNIEVSDVPASATLEMLLANFPGASDAYPVKPRTFTVQFPSEDARRKGIAGKKIINGEVITVSVYGGLNRKVAFIKNISYDATVDDVLRAYPKAKSVDFHRNGNGRPNGCATIEFATSADCEAAINKETRMLNRNVFISWGRVIIGPEQMKKINAEQEAKRPVKSSIPMQVGSESEDGTDDYTDDHDDEQVEGETDKEDSDDEEGSDQDEEEDSDDDEEESDEDVNTELSAKKQISANASDESVDDDNDGDEEESDDESDDGSEDEGIDDASEDEDMPPPKQARKDINATNPKRQEDGNKNGFKFGDGNRGGFRGRGRGDGGFRGRGEGGFRGRGGGGFRGRGGGGFRGRGGGGRSRGTFNRGRGGRGRGNF